MFRTRHRQFLASLAVMAVFAFVVAALITPPDPVTQALAGGALLLVAVPVLAVAVYAGWVDRLWKAID